MNPSASTEPSLKNAASRWYSISHAGPAEPGARAAQPAVTRLPSGPSAWPMLKYRRSTAVSSVGDEHIFPAVIGVRLTGEPGIERLQLESGDVEEPEPLVLRCPPEGAPRAVVE